MILKQSCCNPSHLTYPRMISLSHLDLEERAKPLHTYSDHLFSARCLSKVNNIPLTANSRTAKFMLFTRISYSLAKSGVWILLGDKWWKLKATMSHSRKPEPTSVNEKASRVPIAFPIEQELQESTPKACCRRAYEHDSFLSRSCFVQRSTALYVTSHLTILTLPGAPEKISRVWKGVESHAIHRQVDVTKWVCNE